MCDSLVAWFRELGCTYRINGSAKRKRDEADDEGEAAAAGAGARDYIVKLKCPLVFPKPKKGSKSR